MRSLILILLMSFSVPALAVYKCEFADKVVYSDQPCQKGKMQELSIASPRSDPDDARQRLEQDKQQLETRRKQQEDIEEKKRQKAFKAHQSLKKKCASLAQRVKWANEDFENASVKSREKMRRKAQRASEKYQLTCGN